MGKIKPVIMIIFLIFIIVLLSNFMCLSKAADVSNTENKINVVKNDIESNNTENGNEIQNNVIDNSIENENVEENNIKNDVENKEKSFNDVKVDTNTESEIPLKANSTQLGVMYDSHVENIGWQSIKSDGDISGTTGQGLRIEAFHIYLYGQKSNDIKIDYQAHVENVGWQDWKSQGQEAGTTGRGLQVEALKIRLENTYDYSIEYRAHVENIGWQDWKSDGEIAGTTGKDLRVEAIQIRIVPKIVKVRMYIDTPQNNYTYYSQEKINVVGWKMCNIPNTKIVMYIDNQTTPISDENITYQKRPDVIKAITNYGTQTENPNPGFNASIDISKLSEGDHTVTIDVCKEDGTKIAEQIAKFKLDKQIHIRYRSHVENVGWQEYIMDGHTSGTTGRQLKIEAMNIELLNAPKNAKILYQAHVQDIGWQDWKSNGEEAGTTGKDLRIESIKIRLENMDKYTVEYQVHVQDRGWTDWYIDGETAGTFGKGKRIEAIRIRLVPKYRRGYNGIDVSEFNHTINWWNVKSSGVDFAFIRVGYRGYGRKGNFREDANYKTNIETATSIGLPVGVYFVTQATTYEEAVEEANWVIDRIKDYTITYPVAIDIEAAGTPTDPPRTQNLSKTDRTYLARVFCSEIQKAGYTPIVYTNENWARNYLNIDELSSLYDIWLASYTDDINKKPGYTGSYSIWQYTSHGNMSGILGYVDLNICYKKY